MSEISIDHGKSKVRIIIRGWNETADDFEERVNTELSNIFDHGCQVKTLQFSIIADAEGNSQEKVIVFYTL
jgi:hypothetical protein